MTAAAFKLLYPAFATEQNDVITRHIAAVAPRFDSGRWDTLYNEGLAALVAHRIAIEEHEKAAGVSLSVDAVSFSGPNGSITRSTVAVERGLIDEFSRTSYGRRYRQLVRLVGMGATAV